MKRFLFIIAILIPIFAQAFPFVTTTDPTTYPIHWYQLKCNGYYLYNQGGFVYPGTSASTDDNHLWCFVTSSSGRTLICNKETKMYLSDGIMLTPDTGESTICYAVPGSGQNFYVGYYSDGLTLYSDFIDGELCPNTGMGNPFTVVESLVEEKTDPKGTIFFQTLEVQEECCVVTARYTGQESCTISIIVEGQKMRNPASIARQEQDRTVQVEAVVEFDDPKINSISRTKEFTIPALNIDPTGEIVFEDLFVEEQACIVSASYTGPEECTVSIYFNGTNVGNPTQFGRSEEDWVVDLEAKAVFADRRIRTITKTATITIPARDNPATNDEITLTPIDAYTPNNAIDLHGDEGFEKLFDQDKATKWCVENRSGSWQPIWVDFKSNKPFTPVAYMLTTGNDTRTFTGRNPKAWKIYVKAKENDEWATLVEVNDGASVGLGTESSTDYYFDINGLAPGCQYFRFEVTDICGADGWNSNYYVFQLAEFAIGGPISSPVAPVRGDLNGDGIVDVTDVSLSIDMVLGKLEKDLTNGDLNDDGNIDVTDVSLLIDIVLGKA